MGSVDHLLGKRGAASDLDGLGTVMSFAAARAAGGGGLGSTQIFGAGQFVGGVIDDFVWLDARRGVGTEAVNFAGKNHENENQKCLQQERRGHATVRENSMGSFSGQARGGEGEGGTDGGGELLPARGPLDQELGSLVEVGEFFELESVGHDLNRLV